MYESEDASITEVKPSSSDFTCITFWPDFKRFGMNGFDDDAVALFKKRVIDIAGVTEKSLQVHLNGKPCKAQKFEDYVDLYPGMGEDKMKSSFACPNDRWQICIRPSNMDYQQISFVNSIWTIRGGQHVKMVVDQAISKISDVVSKKNKKLNVQPQSVRPFLWVFVNAKIENPAFDTQTKTNLITPRSKFGSTCDVPQKMIDGLCKIIGERIVEKVNNRINRLMDAKVGAASRSRIIDVPKLDDANDAGTRKGSLCTLILTEGDSAKAMVTSGLGKVGRDRYGCFPLRGKVLNVRTNGMDKVRSCKEIQNLMKIIGLKLDQKYTAVDKLRYGSVMIMTDQDHDGSHIKGLLINLFHYFWPGLLDVPGFLVQFITPIVKAFPIKGSRVDEDNAIAFYTIPDFLKFKEQAAAERKRYEYKYYKGLGTSTAKEAKEYFQEIDTHKVSFVYDDDGTDDRNIKMAMGGDDQVPLRKKWITTYNNDNWVDYNIKQLGYSDFINKEYILYCIAAGERTIPRIEDGFKPVQRKVMFGAFKRNLVREIKVAQFAGYISEHAAYHHGDKSLHDTIVKMAQNFTGSNNLPFLKPCGQFGSRAAGGHDHASARYIFTRLDSITRQVFPKVDDNLLIYKDDDGKPVEPERYIPIIPTVLCNGCIGVGTGFSTKIPNYNPADLITNTRNMINGNDLIPLVPWYRGYKGTMVEVSPGKFETTGILERAGGVIRITELPIGLTTDSFKDELLKKQQDGLVIEFRNHMTGDDVDVDVALRADVLAELPTDQDLIQFFGLSKTMSTTNMVCFDSNYCIKKYENTEEMIREWYVVRLELYGTRKKYLTDELQETCEKLKNMVRFITEVNEGKLKVQNRKRTDIVKDLKAKDFFEFHPKSKKKTSKTATEESGQPEEEEDDNSKYFSEKEAASNESTTGYDYLLGMRIWSLTWERARQLEEQLKRAKADLVKLQNTTVKEMWMQDLDNLERELEKANKEWEEDMKGTSTTKMAKPKGRATRGNRGDAKKTRLCDRDIKPNKLTADQEKKVTAFIKNQSTKKKTDKRKKESPAATKKQKADDGSPVTKPKAKKAAAKRSRKKDSSDYSSSDESSLFVKPKPKTKKKQSIFIDDTSSETVSNGPVPIRGSRKIETSSDSESESESESSSSDVRVKKAPKRSPKKATKKPAPKSRRIIEDDSDSESSLELPVLKNRSKPVAKASPKKASPKKTTSKFALENFVDDDDLNFDLDNFGFAKLQKTEVKKKKSRIEEDSDS
eukprot:TRINITY_DN1716_c0_g1_i2.p1 TRINITY_DN1716_c0_g1~~TRINITY_DN1716_c0_g1_i2.p1  ORF type:complete len:1462 (+),score=358.13 TRINITY_DN1716_c0_g1_i2:623-4387(+)